MFTGTRAFGAVASSASSSVVDWDGSLGGVVLAIDPGESAGVCLIRGVRNGGVAVDTWTVPGELCASALEGFLTGVVGAGEGVVLAIEDYRIFPGMGATHVGKRLFTAELIGALCFVSSGVGVDVVRYQASDKRANRGQMRGRGVPETGATLHERDACCHAWRAVFRGDT